MMACRKNKWIAAGLAPLFLMTAVAVPALAQSNAPDQDIEALDMAVDLTIVRPLSIAGSAVCAVLFVAAFPFTVWTQDRFSRALHLFVIVPGTFAFTRPLGEF